MKFHLYALSLALGLLSATGIANAGQPYSRTKRAQILIQPLIDAVIEGDLALFHTFVKLRRITNFEYLTDAKYGMNALHWAAVLGHCDIIRYLIMHGADVNATTPNGLTALHLATFNNNIEAVKCLVLEGNCNINKPMPSGLTAIHLARGKKNSVLEAFLTRHAKSKKERFAIQLPKNLIISAK